MLADRLGDRLRPAIVRLGRRKIAQTLRRNAAIDQNGRNRVRLLQRLEQFERTQVVLALTFDVDAIPRRQRQLEMRGSLTFDISDLDVALEQRRRYAMQRFNVAVVIGDVRFRAQPSQFA